MPLPVRPSRRTDRSAPLRAAPLRAAARAALEALEPRQLFAAPIGAGYFDLGIGTPHAPYRNWDDNTSLIAGMGRDIAPLPNGRHLVVGEDDRSADWALAQYYDDGTLDKSFDGDGLVFMDFGGIGKADVASDVEVLADGRFVVAGTMTTKSGRVAFAMARFHANGSLDTTFGRMGKVVTDPGASVALPELMVLPDGKLLVGGGAFLARYTADGATDTSFGGGDGVANVIAHSGWDRQASDGKIVAFSEAGGVARVYRYLADGSALDAGFGDGGVVTLPTAPVQKLELYNDPPRGDVAVGHDGSIFVSTSYWSDTLTQTALFRLGGASGAIDLTFGGGGNGYAAPEINMQWHDFTGGPLAVQSDGKILQVVGNHLYRFNIDGTRDTAWAAGGDGPEFQADHSHKVVLASPLLYERAFYTTQSLGFVAITSDTSPYAPYAKPNGPMFYNPDTRILTITGTQDPDVIRVYDEGAYFGIIFNDWETSFIYGDGEVAQLVINAALGNDLIVIGGGYGDGNLPPAYVSGGDGNDTLVGSAAPDTISGNAGKDSINGGGGPDRLAGNGGHDALVGSTGNDRLYGDAGNDKLESGNDSDRLYGGIGDDTLAGGGGVDTFYGGDGADLISGGGGAADRAYYIDASDRLFGITSYTLESTAAGALASASASVREIAPLLQ